MACKWGGDPSNIYLLSGMILQVPPLKYRGPITPSLTIGSGPALGPNSQVLRDLLDTDGHQLVHVIKHDEAYGTMVTNVTAIEVPTGRELDVQRG